MMRKKRITDDEVRFDRVFLSCEYRSITSDIHAVYTVPEHEADAAR